MVPGSIVISRAHEDGAWCNEAERLLSIENAQGQKKIRDINLKKIAANINVLKIGVRS